jgi:hypothetical protein
MYNEGTRNFLESEILQNALCEVELVLYSVSHSLPNPAFLK